MDVFQDVFISYGRADSKAFAVQLHQKLLEQSLKVWLDQNDIPLGVDYQNQINEGLIKSHNFLFIISPHAVNSDYCRKEIELAAQLNKRIIPVLHVQCIDYHTWQQRYPNGTEAEWKVYQIQGLHYGDTRNPNMHSAIAKINWLNYQDGECDPDDAFQKLLHLIDSEREYVYEHTFILAKALEWERHQKQIRYLLVGEERADAESWLKIRFQGQSPCEPTDLHCEFICESIENANNLMTQVFISYSDDDKDMMVKLSKALMRESFTIWTNKTDIQTGESFQAAINRGIEQADNIVYLMSPHSVKSDYCQKEISYALSLNKRIIPILVQPIESTQIPSSLQALQFIDFTVVDKASYQTAIAKLLNVLQDDAQYYEQHKLLLTKALKWERQNRNASILLRGYNLRQAEAWLKLAKGRSQYPPLAIQQTFILESLNQPEDTTQDVFISYSRVDSDFARKLNDALQLQGKTTWFDQESIASGVDFQQEIYRGIENSDNMLFIITPSSVKSPYCADEVEYAMKLNKRIVTVLHRSIDTADLHPGLAMLQWIDFNQHNQDFHANFGELVRTLDSDREHVRSHTKWSQRSLEWQTNNRSGDVLLRGSEFVVAASWLHDAEKYNKQPPATDLQKAFIATSKTAIEAGVKREKLRLWVLRSLLAAVSMALVVAIGQWRRAQTVQEGQIIALSKYSNALFQANQEFEALIEAIRAGKQLQAQFHQAKPTTKNQVMETLLQAFYSVRESNRLVGHEDYVSSVAFSPNGDTIATASNDGTVKLWDRAGQLLNTLPVDELLETSVKFSPDGQHIATGGNDATVKLWSRSGQLLHTFKGHSAPVNDISFSADGEAIASASFDNTIKLWSRSGQLLHTLNGHQDLVVSVSFSPDGTLLASGSSDQTVKLWTRAGRELKTLSGHSGTVNSVAFSPDGQTIASASDDGTVKLWNRSGQLVQTLEGHQKEVTGVSFSPDGQTIATVSWDQSIILWNRQGQRLQTIKGHRGWVNHVSFSPDGRLLATASNDNTVKLWLQPQQVLHVLSAHLGLVTMVSYSPDGQLIATAATDGAKLWSASGQLLHSLNGHTGWVMSIQFSPDGQTIGTVSGDRTIKLWNRSGQLRHTIPESAAVIGLSFSPDGKTFVTGSDDGTVNLWNYAGQRLHQFQGHDEWIQDVAFSPDGQRFATASRDGTAKIWSRTGRLLHILKGHHNWVNGVRFSPDGQMLATASGDGTVNLWNASGQLLQTLTGDEIAFNTIAFSPDGQLIAAGSGDDSISGSNVVRLWTRSGQLLQVLQRHDSYISSLSFSPNGEVLASAGNDTEVVLWDLTIDRLENQMVQSLSLEQVLSEGCRWVRNYLSNSEGIEESDRALCNSE
jgi:WD40 repeat protein